MLHVITPIYRFEFIDKVYDSIPKFLDIKWHVPISNRRDLPTNDCFSKDKRVIVYYLDCEDNDLVTKRNTVFKNINDGYFYLLDDDTIFLEQVYSIYKKYQQLAFKGMVIGKQHRHHYRQVGIANKPYSDPKNNNLDAGMVIAYHDVLRHVKWQLSSEFNRDCLFWSKCYLYFGNEKTVELNEYISIYNHFAPLIRIRKKVFSITVNFDINHAFLSYLYFILYDLKKMIKGQ